MEKGKIAEQKPKKESISHRFAHFVSDHISTPAINRAQYKVFEKPEEHKGTIDRQMHRIFRRAGSSVGIDFGNSMLFYSQATLGVVAEHAAIPLAILPIIGHHLPTSIPLPVDLHLHFKIPGADSGLAQAFNRLPLPDIPKRFDHDGNRWPLFLSTVVTAGLVNIPNAYHAWRDRKPIKRAWYTVSSALAPSHMPFIFNSFWVELATRAPQKHAERVYAEKVEHVLANKPIDKNPDMPPSHTGVWIVDKWKDWRAKRKEMASGDIHIHPGSRDIFVQAVENRFTKRKPREWWEEKLADNAEKTVNDKRFGIKHQEERVTYHEDALEKSLSKRDRLYHSAWRRFHNHARERAEEKLEAIHTAQKFLSLTA